MKGALLVGCLAFVPVAATALSCTPHSIEAAFVEADADDARFVIVRGTLDFDEGALPKVDYNNQQDTPDMTLIKGRLSGASLSGTGFNTAYNKPVTIAVACFGPWCASAQANVDVLVFVELTEDGDAIATNPCGGNLFTNPTKKMIRAVKRCFAGKTCTPVK